MRALVLEDWWNLVVTDVPDPEPGEHEVILEVLATGICGSDIHGFTGETGRRHQGQVMGHETVGRIVALGKDVDPSLGIELGAIATVNPVIGCGMCEQCRAGQEQACPDLMVIGVEPTIRSAFAEQMVVDEKNIVLVDRAMPPEYGALIEPLSVGYHAVRRARARPGDTVLVLGGGPIGQACVLGALREGARAVVVSEPIESRRQINAELGASTIDPDGTDLASAVRGRLGGRPTVVIDAVGTTASMTSALSCAAPASAIVLVGMGSPQLQLPAYEVSTRERSIIGSFCYSAAEFRNTAEWVGTAPAELGLLIEHRVGLAAAPATFAQLARGEMQASKVLVLLSEAVTEDVR